MIKIVAWYVVVLVIASLTLTFLTILVQSDLKVDLLAFSKIVFSWQVIGGALALVFKPEIQRFLTKQSEEEPSRVD